MDPAVDDELVEGHPGHLAADRVEAADDDGFGGVVDDDVDAGRLLESPDVAALPPDDPALHVFRRKGQHRNRGLGCLVCGDPLDRLGDDRACPLLAVVAGSQLGLTDLAGALVAELLFELAHEDAGGLGPGHVGDALQFDQALLEGFVELRAELVELLFALAQPGLPAAELIGLAVEVLLLLEEPLLELEGLGLGLSSFALGLGPDLDRGFLGLEQPLLQRRLDLRLDLRPERGLVDGRRGGRLVSHQQVDDCCARGDPDDRGKRAEQNDLHVVVSPLIRL